MVENVKVKKVKVKVKVKSKNTKHERKHLVNRINLVLVFELNKNFVSIKVYI